MGQKVKIGEVITIMITSMVGRFQAEVIGFDTQNPPKPILKVLHPGWEQFPLKDGDYIIIST